MQINRQTNLYHCTNGDSLIGILSSKHYRYSYCLEEYYGRKDKGFTNELIAYAMVCFADLYANELEAHMNQFKADSYLMMEKPWANKNRICPVMYYTQDSLSNWAFLGMIKYILDINKDLVSFFGTEAYDRIDEDVDVLERIWDNTDKLHKSLELFRPFFKRYKGCYFMKNKGRFSNEPTEFFLEREWRSFPVVKNGERMFLSEDDYHNETLRKSAINELEKNNKLEFGWKDIKQIGCKEGEKSIIIHAIRESFGVNEDEAETKIIIIHK